MSETKPTTRNSLPPPQHSLLSAQWRVYAKTKTTANLQLDLRQTTIVTGALQAVIQRVLSGRTLRELMLLPLAQVGSPVTSALLQGIALCAPRSTPEEVESLQASLIRVADFDKETGLHELGLKVASKGLWRLRLEGKCDDYALQPARYLAAASDWGTVTPVILSTACRVDDLAKRRKIATAEIQRACADTGLPRPIEVQFSVKSSVFGAPSLKCPDDGPFGRDWKLPEQLSGRPIHHVLLRFAQPVQGPVVLGAGRFRGMGLCLPVNQTAVD